MPTPPDYPSDPPLAEQISAVRAEFGRTVREKLSTILNVQKLPAHNAEIYWSANFMSAAECATMVAQIDEGCGPSPYFKDEAHPEHRTSSTCNFPALQAEPSAISDRIATLLGLPPSHGETIQGQRYEAGQHFKVHPDFFFIDQPYWEDVGLHGGQRTWTAMIYLNEPEEGGGTIFPYAGIEVEPKLGRLLIWNNMNPDGSPNAWTFHEGASVVAGTKYVLTKWFREAPWI